MTRVSLRDPRSFAQKILIAFGFVYVSALIGLFVTYWLSKVFVMDRSFTTSSFFGAFAYIFCSSLPNIVFYFIVGLTIPCIISDRPLGWSSFIGLLMVLSRISGSRIHWAGQPELVELLVIWIPRCVILPSCVLGTLISSKSKLLKRNEDRS